MDRGDSGRLVVGAGLVAWAVSVLPAVAAWTSGRTPFDGQALASCVAFVVFGVAYVLAAATTRFAAWRMAALVVQGVTALGMVALDRTGFAGVLLCVVAGEAPLVIGEKRGLALVAMQMAALAVVQLASPFHSRGTGFAALAYVGFQLFAFGASRLAVREMEARAELARVHAELLATRELFADNTRTEERVRIARELHDALGHNLTALSIQLELARNLADGRVKEPVDRALGVTKELLVELRTVVSATREDPRIDLPRAVRTLVAGVPHPRVHLELEDGLRVDAALAHTIFRCVQEALTNAVRHAAAQNVYLAIATKAQTVHVTARDDGRGAAELRPGHGLSGLRERIEELGGSVEIEARQGAGLTLRALLPLRARNA